MTCDYCHQPIQPGEPYDEHAPDRPTGAAPNVRLHREPCKPVPRQTAPSGIGR